MSQVASKGVEQYVMDPYDIGWYIESADEETYGPVSRETIRRFLEDKTISPNTLTRHCTQPEARPVADQPAIMQQFDTPPSGSAVGDHLAEAWPRSKRDKQALAEASLPCAWHKRPATLVCLRCHAPYCNRCRAKPFRKEYFLCRRCQASVYNRRVGAWILDVTVLCYLPFFIAAFAMALLRVPPDQVAIVMWVLYFVCFVMVFFLRDSLFGGAGVGKRAAGLRVVQSKDGSSPLTYGQGVVRWLSQFIPIFNLVDLAVPFRDPLLRRYGDRWAGTRVIDSQRSIAKVQRKIAKRLVKKGVQPPPQLEMTMEGLARLA
jgi:uncharacterized RDD family membrane protein YckC